MNLIDAVVLWVDGSDEKFIQEKQRYWKIYGNTCEVSNSNSRFVSCDELIYCLRGLYFNATWLRHIYLVTNGQIPKWLNITHPKIKLVFHSDIIDPKNLPTFNSNAIEMHLSKIPSLSNIFLYLNDDCFIIKKTKLSTFFNPQGKAYYYTTRHRRISNIDLQKRSHSFSWTLLNNYRCLNTLFGENDHRYRPHHQAYILYKKAIKYVEKHAPDYVESTAKQRFRSNDHSGAKVINPYVFAIAGHELDFYQMQIGSPQQYYQADKAIENYKKILKHRPVFLCINDARSPKHRDFINTLMTKLLPNPAPWEIEEKLPVVKHKLTDFIEETPTNNLLRCLGLI